MGAIQAAIPEELAELEGVDLASARCLVSSAHKNGALPERASASVRRRALAAILAKYSFPQLVRVERVQSTIDGFVKYAHTRAVGEPAFETVCIPLEKPQRFSVCVSSQVGCALACRFCSTGQMGLIRNLEAWEIVEQVRLVRSDLAAGRVHGVVFQGMGEPLANVASVIRAILVLSNPCAQAIDRRNITVCTAGLPNGIRALTAAVPQIRIGLSIADARPAHRSPLMPIDSVHCLDDAIEAVGQHTVVSGHCPMWAYTLLENVNDDADAAAALADRATAFWQRFGRRPRISLIPYNEVSTLPFRRSSEATLAHFREVLLAKGQGSIVRYSGGADVAAACGQLSRLTPGRNSKFAEIPNKI